jgi:hypothetical protein
MYPGPGGVLRGRAPPSFIFQQTERAVELKLYQGDEAAFSSDH